MNEKGNHEFPLNLGQTSLLLSVHMFKSEEEYSLMSVGKTTAIIAAVVLPLILIIVCVIFHLIRRKDKEVQNERRQPVMTTSFAAQQSSMAENPSSESLLQSHSRETEVN